MSVQNQTLEARGPVSTDTAKMVLVRGGRFIMGSDSFYPEERPCVEAQVDDFWIDANPVRNRDFAAFVKATGYVTLAERVPSLADYPDADPALLVPGSAVFTAPTGPVNLREVTWWSYAVGASWRTPDGRDAVVSGRDDHPVVQIAHEDAEAYCRWARKSLPTEAEWEFAALGGLDAAGNTWWDEPEAPTQPMANIWLGQFPVENLKASPPGTTPVGSFPANGLGLYDLLGNVWEWTASRYVSHAQKAAPRGCCGSPSALAQDPTASDASFVIKGGSYLCAPNYCRRYRPAARIGQPADSSTNHIGFRCVRRFRTDLALLHDGV